MNKKIEEVFKKPNKENAFKILDYIEEIILFFVEDPISENLREDIDFHNIQKSFYLRKEYSDKKIDMYFDNNPKEIYNTKIYKATEIINKSGIYGLRSLDQFFIFILLQFIDDLLGNRSQHEHISPVIHRFKSKQNSIEKTFEITDDADIWADKNIIVLNLNDVNIDMKKTIPLLIAKYIYDEHKKKKKQSILSIVIDEAHNILSKTSFRETENWKDYRLETFEEIIDLFSNH